MAAVLRAALRFDHGLVTSGTRRLVPDSSPAATESMKALLPEVEVVVSRPVSTRRSAAATIGGTTA